MAKKPYKKKKKKKSAPRKIEQKASAFQNFPSVKVKEGSEEEGMRLNKYVAHCGVCSRRQAADEVKAGQVMVNDKVVLEPFYQVAAGDVVKYKGKVIKPEAKKVYYLLNKPNNYITTTSDEKGRRTVMDIVKKKVKERVFPVGRLDRQTTGLLLFTNDGDLSLKMTHPSYEMSKVYNVGLDKPITEEHFKAIREGFELEDGPVMVDSLHVRPQHGPQDLVIELHIGRNRIVRRIFAHFGYTVEKLDRVYLGGLTKKDLPRGYIRPLSEQEVIMLKHFSKKK